MYDSFIFLTFVCGYISSIDGRLWRIWRWSATARRTTAAAARFRSVCTAALGAPAQLCMSLYTHAHARANAHAHARTHARVYIHTCARPRICAHTRAHMLVHATPLLRTLTFPFILSIHTCIDY